MKPCKDNQELKKDNLEIYGELASFCDQTVLTCLYLVRIGRSDTFVDREHTNIERVTQTGRIYQLQQ